MYGNKINTCRILWEDLRGGEYLEDPGVDERIILKWVFKKWNGIWTGLIGLALEQVAGFCK
jgi:hypothetical protein